jgi:hypothetical protein
MTSRTLVAIAMLTALSWGSPAAIALVERDGRTGHEGTELA